MYARIAQISLKPEKRDEFLQLLNQEFLPLLKKQPGCVDSVGLVSEEDSNIGLALTFWKDRNAANRFYDSDSFLQMQRRITPYLKRDVMVRTYDVASSTYHHIAASHAA